MAMVHKFEKILAKHGFVLSSTEEKNAFGQAKYTEYTYRNPSYKGRITVWVWHKDKRLRFSVMFDGQNRPRVSVKHIFKNNH